MVFVVLSFAISSFAEEKTIRIATSRKLAYAPLIVAASSICSRVTHSLPAEVELRLYLILLSTVT